MCSYGNCCRLTCHQIYHLLILLVMLCCMSRWGDQLLLRLPMTTLQVIFNLFSLIGLVHHSTTSNQWVNVHVMCYSKYTCQHTHSRNSPLQACVGFTDNKGSKQGDLKRAQNSIYPTCYEATIVHTGLYNIIIIH